MKTKLHFSTFPTKHASKTSFGSALMMAVMLLLALGGGNLLAPFSSSAKQNGEGSKGKQSIQPLTCPAPTKQIIYAPLIDLPEASSSEINLNCRSSHPMDVTPTFYKADGTPIVGEVIHLQPADILFLDTKSLIPAEHRNRRDWGGMSLSYMGQYMEAWAQITLHGVNGGDSVNVLFSVLNDARSNSQGAVWWMPQNGEATIALGNGSGERIHATLEFSDGKSRDVNLDPFATEIVTRHANQRGGRPALDGKSESVIINSTGPKGSLIARGIVGSADGKFTGSIRFYDTQKAAQPNLYSTRFRLKNVVPRVLLRNTTAEAIEARPRFLPESESNPVELAAMNLGPNETAEVNLAPLMAAVEVRSDLDDASIQIINNGAPGSLIGALYGVDKATGMVYDVPLRDSGSLRNSTGGYPIRLDGDYSTIISITNVSEVPTEFVAQVNYEGGPYLFNIHKLAAGETATLDFRKIRDEQISDWQGHTLPASFTRGQFRWSIHGGGDAARLTGRAEILSLSKRVSSSYSCMTNCPFSGQSWDFGFSGFFDRIPAGGFSRDVTVYEYGSDCTGFPMGPFGVAVTLSSNNPSIASTDGCCAYTGVAPGFTTIVASGFSSTYDCFNDCFPGTVPFTLHKDVSVVGVQKIQYQSDSGFTDVSGTLYVLKGTSVTFKAIPAPANEPWPGGKPVWGGTSGASGTGDTKSVTFNTASSSTSDFKMVIAESGNIVVVNVIVYDLIDAFIPRDNFIGRSLTNYGLAEVVDLSFTATPPVTAAQAGGLRWKISSGGGTMTAADDGNGIYTAPSTAGPTTLKLEVLGGPSKGLGPSFNITIIAPNGVSLAQFGSGIRHVNGLWSVGFRADWYLLPKNVSFRSIQMGEGSVLAVATGYLSVWNNLPHMVNGPYPIGDCNIATGCKALFPIGPDEIYSGERPPPFSPGDFLWSIPVEYLAPGGSRIRITSWNHHATADGAGRACIDKVVGPFCKNEGDPNSSW